MIPRFEFGVQIPSDSVCRGHLPRACYEKAKICNLKSTEKKRL